MFNYYQMHILICDSVSVSCLPCVSFQVNFLGCAEVTFLASEGLRMPVQVLLVSRQVRGGDGGVVTTWVVFKRREGVTREEKEQ